MDIILTSLVVVMAIIQKIIYHKSTFCLEGRKKQAKSNSFFRYVLHLAHALFGLSIVSKFYPSLSQFNFTGAEGWWTLPGALLLGAVGLFVLYKGRNDLADLFSDCFNAYAPKSLFHGGIYSYIRHPIYSGNIIISLANFVALPNLFSLSLVVSIFSAYLMVIKREEHTLMITFENYSNYRKSTGPLFPKVVFSHYKEEKIIVDTFEKEAVNATTETAA